MSAFKRKDWDRNDLLQIVLYHDSIQKNENGWFNVDEIINHISGLHRGMNKPEYDFRMLEKRVNKDTDHRYIFNDDKTLLRISPDHIAPKYVEEELKTAGNIEIKQSVFAYYFVFWMVPAVVGKLFGLLAARIVLLIWSAIGLILIAIGALILYGKQSRFLFIGLVLFAGFDVFPYLYNEYISGFGATWEDWTWHFRVVGNFYQLMNVFHQSLPGWLITLLLLLCTNSKSIGLLGSLMFCYSPWAAIGVLPMCICKLIITNRKLKAKEVLKNLFTIGNLVAPVVFLVCFATFYTANSNATYDYGFIWTFYGNKFTMVIDYVAYVVFEFGLWVLLIHKKYKKDWMFYCAILTMLIIPIYKMTGPNDLLMRGSMAPLFAIGLYAVMFVTDSFNEMMEKGNKKVKPRLVVLSLLVAAFTSFNFMLTSTLLTAMTYAKMEPETDIKTGIESFGNINDEQYIVMVQAQFYVYDYENNVFFKYLAK